MRSMKYGLQKAEKQQQTDSTRYVSYTKSSRAAGAKGFVIFTTTSARVQNNSSTQYLMVPVDE